MIAEKLAAMAHPARLAVLRILVEAGPNGVAAGQLGKSLGIASNALTFHLQKLSGVGLVNSRRNGQFIIYSAVFEALLDVTDYLVGTCCAASMEKCGPGCSSAGTSPMMDPLTNEGVKNND